MAGEMVKLDSAGMAELLNSDDVMAMLRDEAEPKLAAAISSAPVASGAYRDSLGIVEDHTDRARVRIVSTADHGLIVEANTGNLARALDA